MDLFYSTLRLRPKTQPSAQRSPPAGVITSSMQRKTVTTLPFLLSTYGGFLLAGVMACMVGPLLQLYVQRWGLNDAEASRFLVFEYAAAPVAVLLSSLLPRRWPVLTLGLAMLAAGFAGLNSSSQAVALSSTIVLGAGTGLCVAIINQLVARRYAEKAEKALNLVNFFWGLGAMFSPMTASLALRLGKLSWTLLFFTTLTAMLALLAWSIRAAEPGEAATEAHVEAAAPARGMPAEWLLFAAILLIYGGLESSVPGWASVLAVRKGVAANAAEAASYASWFWGMLMVGRALASAFLKRSWTGAAALGGMIAAVGAMLLLISSANQTSFIAAIAMNGLFFSTLYTKVIAEASRRYHARHGWMTMLFAMGGIGAALLPGLVGALSKLSGSLAPGLAALTAFTLLDAVLLLLMLRRSKA